MPYSAVSAFARCLFGIVMPEIRINKNVFFLALLLLVARVGAYHIYPLFAADQFAVYATLFD